MDKIDKNDPVSNETKAPVEVNPTSSPSSATEPETTELRKPFGDWLKEERVSRKISLEEIAAVTKVHISQLRALEENDVSKLPAPAFVRGFLVSYARHLNIDENVVLERYKSSYGTLTPLTDLLMPTSSRAAKSTSYPKVRIVTSPHIKQAPSTREVEKTPNMVFNFRNMAVAATLLGLALLLMALIALGRKAKTPHLTELSPDSHTLETSKSAEKSTEKTTDVPSTHTKMVAGAAIQTVAQAPAPAPVVVPKMTKEAVKESTEPKKYGGEVRALEQSWVNVRIDDGESKGMMLHAGTSFPFQAGRRVTFSFSDAGSIEIKWNGVWYVGPGSRGDVKTLSLPEQLPSLTAKVSPHTPRAPSLKARAKVPTEGAAPASDAPNAPPVDASSGNAEESD